MQRVEGHGLDGRAVALLRAQAARQSPGSPTVATRLSLVTSAALKATAWTGVRWLSCGQAARQSRSAVPRASEAGLHCETQAAAL